MAVYTELTFAQAKTFLSQFDIGSLLRCDGIAQGVENSNFLIKTRHGRYILTIYEKRVRQEDLPWFLGLMRYVSAQGFSVPAPIADRRGHIIHKIAGKAGALTSFLPGRSVSQIDEEHCFKLGQALAVFHKIADGYRDRRVNTMGISSWAPLLAQCGEQADNVKSGLYGFLKKALKHIIQAWPHEGEGLPKGQIHADLFPDNVFFEDGDVSGFIDFYFACTDYLAYDIAICLCSWCFNDENVFQRHFGGALLRGYQQERPLEETELHFLPIFMQGAALRFLLTRLYDWIYTPQDAFVERKDPLEYLTKYETFKNIEGGDDLLS